MTAFLNSTAFWPGVEWPADVWLANIVFAATAVATVVFFFTGKKHYGDRYFKRLVMVYLLEILILLFFANIW